MLRTLFGYFLIAGFLAIFVIFAIGIIGNRSQKIPHQWGSPRTVALDKAIKSGGGFVEASQSVAVFVYEVSEDGWTAGEQQVRLGRACLQVEDYWQTKELRLSFSGEKESSGRFYRAITFNR